MPDRLARYHLLSEMWLKLQVFGRVQRHLPQYNSAKVSSFANLPGDIVNLFDSIYSG